MQACRNIRSRHGPSFTIILFHLLATVLNAGCVTTALRAESDMGVQVTSMLVADDGSIIESFGASPREASKVLASRIELCRSRLGRPEYVFDRDNGSVLMATRRGEWEDAEAQSAPRTLVWYNWVEQEAPLVFTLTGGYVVTDSFVELIEYDDQGAPSRLLVDLRDPARQYVVPNDLLQYDVQSNRRWIGRTNRELLDGDLLDGQLQVSRRMPFAGQARGSVAWTFDSRYVLAYAAEPVEMRNQIGARKDTVLVDCEEWRFVDQSADMYLYGECALKPTEGWNLSVSPETVVLLARRGSDGEWGLAAMTAEGTLEWLEHKTEVDRTVDPQRVSPEANLILCRQRSIALRYPGDSPRLFVRQIVADGHGRDLLKREWTEIGGWLVAPAQDQSE